MKTFLHLSIAFVLYGTMNGENLSYLSTEQPHPKTMLLSQTMHKNCIEGLKLLNEVDVTVIHALREFSDKYAKTLANAIAVTRANKGKVFLMGSGSSGLIAIDIAARCGKDAEVIGAVTGGDGTFYRARIIGCEDSEDDGRSTVKAYNVTAKDLVILISASGSASFNVGGAKQARETGAQVYYFYNSRQVPAKTEFLFNQLGVIPLMVDIGPQAITGSTRLQAASLARLALGSVLTGQCPEKIALDFEKMNTQIVQKLDDIARIIHLQHAIFANPNSNFRRIKDETSQGYITYVNDAITFRDLVMDNAETAATFSNNPIRMPNDKEKKLSEYQSYLVGDHDNITAWNILLGRSVHPEDHEWVLQFTINEAGIKTRPLGHGNMLVCVAWEDPTPFMKSLEFARQQGAKTALILLSEKSVMNKDLPACDATVILDNLPHDSAGLVASMALKQVVNMIANSTMILMNKVHGNRMIDTNASNNKLVDRAVRLTRDILADYDATASFEYNAVDQLMRSILVHKEEYLKNDLYTPGPVKIAVTMLSKSVDFEQAITLLDANHENLEKICKN